MFNDKNWSTQNINTCPVARTPNLHTSGSAVEEGGHLRQIAETTFNLHSTAIACSSGGAIGTRPSSVASARVGGRGAQTTVRTGSILTHVVDVGGQIQPVRIKNPCTRAFSVAV